MRYVANLSDSKNQRSTFHFDEACAWSTRAKSGSACFCAGTVSLGITAVARNVSPFVPRRDRVSSMAYQNDDQWWPLGIVRLVVYAAIAIAVGYSIVRFWPAYYWPH
jgi:hypothetical protein